MGLESGDLTSIVSALKQIISNCVLEPIDADSMAMVDMEILFLNLRARSMGEVGNQFFKCKNEITIVDPTDPEKTILKECKMLIDIPVEFLKIPVINTDRPKDIRLADDLGVKMKYPTFALTQLVTTLEPDDIEVTVVANCIESIYTKDEVFNSKDAKQEELINFVLNLPTDKYELIKDFALNTPRNQLIVNKKCTKCGYDHTITLEGIQDFFS